MAEQPKASTVVVSDDEQTGNNQNHIKIETDVIDGFVFKSITETHYTSNENDNSNILLPTTTEEICDKIKIETDYSNRSITETHYTSNENDNSNILLPTTAEEICDKIKIETDYSNICNYEDVKMKYSAYTKSSNINIVAPMNKTPIKICTVCRNESFNKVSKLKKHMTTHIKVKIISRKINLRSRSTVNTLKKFQCNICSKLYTEMSRIKKHMETHMEDKSVLEKKGLLNKSTVAINVEQKFNCDACDKCFPTLTRLNTHVQIIHEQKETRQQNNIKPFSDSLNLRKEIKHEDIIKAKEYDVYQNSCSINEETKNSSCHIKTETDIVDGYTFESILTREYNSTSSFNTCTSNSTTEEMIKDKIKIEAVIVDDSTTRGLDNVVKTEIIDDPLCSKHLQTDAMAPINEESMKSCDICNRSFLKKSLLRKHMESHMTHVSGLEKNHSVFAEKKFKCLVCDKRFTASSTMKVHTRIFHTEKKVYKCNICHKAFSDILYLRRHRKYHAEKPHQCEVCKKSFPLMSNLKVHMNIHTGIKPWKCNVCQRVYADRTAFKRHMQYHDEGYSFKCNICNRTLMRRNSAQKHMISHSNEKNYTNKKYKCNICENSYNTSFALKRHMTIHTGEKQFMCDVCKKSFATKAHVKRHIIINHMQAKYKCKICNKLYSDAYYFKLHKTLHANNKPYECNHCNKLFSHRTFLTIHLRNHRKRYECNICKRFYYQKKTLKNHMKLFHSD